jgi:mono/diheme cytochrome c family protein
MLASMCFRSGLVLALCLWVVPSIADGETTQLRFARDGVLQQSVERDALVAGCAPVRIQIKDPYYQREKTFRACPFHRVLALGFGDAILDPQANVFLRALDGYTQTASVERLRGAGAQVDPAPYYLVWTGDSQQDLHQYPWPYQLAQIDIAPFEREYPHTLPAGVPPGKPAWTGFEIFRTQCVICHAVNGEGGRVGPELNVPRSIVEYRPVEQIRDYIRDPGSFRHTSMPSHRHLDAAELDALITYFRAMSTRKHDPGNPHGH